jgi:hypothetical protein
MGPHGATGTISLLWNTDRWMIDHDLSLAHGSGLTSPCGPGVLHCLLPTSLTEKATYCIHSGQTVEFTDKPDYLPAGTGDRYLLGLVSPSPRRLLHQYFGTFPAKAPVHSLSAAAPNQEEASVAHLLGLMYRMVFPTLPALP